MLVRLISGPEGSPNSCFGLYGPPQKPSCIQFIQSDWDYPGLVSMLGGPPPCDQCNATDGTVDCPHHTASEMISAAYDWLSEHDGEEFHID